MNKSYGFYAVRFTVTAAFSVVVLIALLAAAETVWPEVFQDLTGPALGAVIGLSLIHI